MKFHTLTAVCTIVTALIATAEVPSLINYQGRLADANGDPVTGSKNLAISIYDAATNGTLLYTETIGAVTLDENGVYSFQFGGSGTSNTLVTETVATTDGTSTTFQKVLDNSPVVANSVSVSDGTYTWSQSVGSSNEDDFGGDYNTSLRRVTANYYNGAPATGRTITATYRYETSSITGALASGAEHWMAVSVDGTVQGTRQRVLAVPFAQRASIAAIAERAVQPTENVLLERIKTVGYGDRNINGSTSGNPITWTIFDFGKIYVPNDLMGIKLRAEIEWSTWNWNGSSTPYQLRFEVIVDGNVLIEKSVDAVHLTNIPLIFEADCDSSAIDSGFKNCWIRVTKSNYSSGNATVIVESPSCNFWLINKPR